MDLAAYEALSAPLEFTLEVPAPNANADCSPFKHAFFAMNPIGHPNWDGKGDGFGQKHVDLHFYMISEEARLDLTGTCVTPPGAGNCLSALPANAAFYDVPPPEYVTGFAVQDTFGGHAVPNHGLHLVSEADLAPGGVADVVSSGENGDWRDCQAQQLSVLRPPGEFVEHDCTVGEWTDGVSPVLISFGGQVIAQEIMPTIAHASMLGDSLPNPFTKPFPVQDAYDVAGYPAIATYSEKTSTRIKLGLELSAEPVAATCLDAEGWHKVGDESKDCEWVGEFPEARCDVKGPAWGQAKLKASYGCRAECGATSCIDSASWHKRGAAWKGCAWVSILPAVRCHLKGEDGSKASSACPDLCSALA